MTSVTEDNFVPSSSKSQFNGSVQADLNHSASMENISSIHNNIFYKTFGKPVKYPSSSPSKPTTNSDERFEDSTNDNDENMEYRPVSGFVHRLMGRFSKGDSTSTAPSSSPSSASLAKRSSSMEDISMDNDSSQRNAEASLEGPTIANPQKQNVLISSNLSHRARSIECLSAPAPSRKPQARPLAIPHLRHVETKQDKEKPLKSPRESKVIAPDVDLARDDIIIIENTPSVPGLQLASVDQHNDSDCDFEQPQVHSYREEMLPEELPKPNTVFTVRSIFETASSVSTTPSSALAQRRRRSDSSEFSNEKTTQGSSSVSSETNANRISNRNTASSISSPTPPVLSPRVASSEASAAPVFKLDQSSHTSVSSSRSPNSYSSQRSPVFDLYSPHYNIHSDGKSSPLSSSTTTSTTIPAASTAHSLPPSYTKQLSSSRQSTPRDDDNSSKDSSLASTSSPSSARNDQGSSSTPSSNSSTTEISKLPSVVERGSLFDSRSAPSPRSTASVKPTIAQNPPAAVKPIPLSAPASAATSYKKSSPVVPVAPFKKREEAEDDGTPVLIYQKSKSPRSKPERQNLNNVNGKQVNNKEEKDDLIIQKDAKTVFEKEKEIQSAKQKKNNDILDLKSNNDNFKNDDSKLGQEDKNNSSKVFDKENKQNTSPHTSVISVTKEKTVINLTKTNVAAAVTDDSDQVDGTSKRIKNTSAPSIPQPARPPRSKGSELIGKSRPAPMPPKLSDDGGKKPEDRSLRQGSMIYISSSDSSNDSDSSTPPETPRTQPTPALRDPTPVIQPTPALRDPTPVIQPSPRESAPIIPPSPREPPVKPREIPSISPSPREPQRIPREPPSSSPSPLQPRIVPEPEPSDEPKDKPIKGIPSIIANRLNKQNNSPREMSDAIIESNGRDSPDAFAVTLRKTGSPSVVTSNNEDENKRDSVSNDIEMQIANMRKKMDQASRNRSGSGTTQIFDSSQLAQKRKERKEAAAKAAAAATSQGIVPPLDFSSLNDNNRSNQAYMRKKEIKPCNIKFIGENAPTSRNLLMKQRKVKIHIQFREDLCDTFEYPSEDFALQSYMEEHPNEPEEEGFMFLNSIIGGFGESSDDLEDDDSTTDVSTPRGGRDGEEDGLKSNPALSSTSTLQSYRGRFQEEFVFGSHRQEPEPVITKQEPELVEDPDSMMLRPAEEETVDTWSTNNSSDLLF